jgi:hypothetical protein
MITGGTGKGIPHRERNFSHAKKQHAQRRREDEFPCARETSGAGPLPLFLWDFCALRCSDALLSCLTCSVTAGPVAVTRPPRTCRSAPNYLSNSAKWPDLALYAAAWYSLIRPPGSCRRRIRQRGVGKGIKAFAHIDQCLFQAPAASALPLRTAWLVLVVVLIGGIMDLIDSSVASLANPSIRADLGGCGVPELRPRPLNCSFSGSDSSLHAARSYSWISPPRILRRRIHAAARSVTVAVVIVCVRWPQVPAPSAGTACLRYRRYTTGPAAAGPVSTRSWPLLPGTFGHYQHGSRIVSGIPVGSGHHHRLLPA